MRYEQTKQLSSQKFKRLTGISRQTYQLMVSLVKANKASHQKSGRPPQLIVEEQVLLVLQYWREYRTYPSSVTFRNKQVVKKRNHPEA